MKTLFFTIICMYILNTSHAQQNDLAFLNVNASNLHEPSNRKKEPLDLSSDQYYKTVFNANTSGTVNNLEKEILSYNIKNNNIYDNSEAATYQIKFKQKQAKALVTYNNKGIILSSKEVYHNARVPYKISVLIAKSFPEWSLEKSTLKVNYNTITGVNKVYLITIKRKGQNKNIKINGITLKQII